MIADLAAVVLHLGMLAALAALAVSAWRFSSQEVAPEPAEPWKPAPPAWALRDWTPRPMEVAREMHVGALARLVHVHSRGAVGNVECVRGRWRAWIEAPSFDEAGLRAEWSTRAGALRRLLGVILAHGGAWHGSRAETLRPSSPGRSDAERVRATFEAAARLAVPRDSLDAG